MFTYLKRSVDKFRQDALSKVLYDFLKYIIFTLLPLILARFIPKDTSIGLLINKNLNVTIITILIIVILTVCITLIVTLLIFTKKYKILQKDNFTDELTGILNHKAFNDILPKTIEICRKQNQKLSLIIIDIDNFKLFNSDYGFQIGDKVLSKVGNLLNSDNRATDILFRQYFKGDEFIILAKNTELSNAIKAAHRKKDLFKTGIVVDTLIHQLTVSCGVTEFDFNTDTQEMVLKRLNDAKQMAKSHTNKNYVESLI